MQDEPEGLEPAALDRLFRVGGHEFVIEMIDLFLAHAPQRIETAIDAVAAGDHVTVHRSAHSLKSTAANIGALRLQAIAAQVEAEAGAGAAGLESAVERMRECFEQLRASLVAERASRQALVDPSTGTQ